MSLWSDATRQQAAAAEKELQQVSEERLAELDKLVAETFERELEKLPAEIQPKAREVRGTAADKRTPEQQQLIKEYPFLNVDRGSVYLYLSDRLTTFTKKWDEKTAEVQKKRPADDLVQCLTEVPGQIPKTRLLFRGDFNQPRQEIGPGELAILNSSGTAIADDDPQIPTSGRRLAYARHLISGRHPLTARVLVNRFWHHHFGRGLASTLADFGELGARPTHPDLLDWLADDFVAGGWKLKRWHRLVVTSTAYRQSSERRAELDRRDPENRWLGRMNVRRLEAETIRDSILSLSGKLSTKQYGPPIPVAPDDVGQIVVSVDTRDSAGRPTGKTVSLGEDEFRRSIYIQFRRTMPLGVLEPFDEPVMSPNCQQRNASTVAPQSLLLMNSSFVSQQADAMAARMIAEVGNDLGDQFRRAWRLAYGRSPSEENVAAGVGFLKRQIDETPVPAADAKPPAPSRERVALANLCQALMSSNGFLYVD